ncbi:hypothetical protein WJX84_006848 [Apatococcus fuscideae]|uniref:Uncharacterized protein n=1 Tax=Apatococcus fuscideae TaxID=2026836 RepID=A0AAW1SW42_9CHLO
MNPVACLVIARARDLQAMGLVRSYHEGKHAAMRDVEAFWEKKFQQRNLKEGHLHSMVFIINDVDRPRCAADMAKYYTGGGLSPNTKHLPPLGPWRTQRQPWNSESHRRLPFSMASAGAGGYATRVLRANAMQRY